MNIYIMNHKECNTEYWENQRFIKKQSLAI